MTETKCGAFEEVKKLNKRFDSMYNMLIKEQGEIIKHDDNIAWHEAEINNNKDDISKLDNKFDIKLTEQNNKMKEGEKKLASMIVKLSQVIDSMRNSQYGGKRKTRRKKSKRKKKRKTKKKKKRKTKKRFRNQRGCKR